jgi:hypothetical protein
LLAQSLLPPFGGALADAFASEGYAEFVAYVGITGLVLAGSAAVRMVGARGTARQVPSRHDDTGRVRAPAGALPLLALAGLFLALGAYNPFYYPLWRFAPGFQLFRAPVRWLELTALGLAVLAAIGLDEVGLRTTGMLSRAGMSARRPKWLPARRATQFLAAMLAGGLIALLVYQKWPGIRTILMWLAIVALAGAGLWAGLRWPRAARAGLLGLAVFELWLASRALPFTAATAPYVLSLRNAPAALLAEVGEQPAAGRERFLSMSDIRYDPGDLAELRQMMAGSLPSDAIERLVRGAKQTEVIAPNLSLRMQLPGVDGYDGGLLPTQDYGKLQTLFLPADQRLPDGRMREQLRQIPAGQLLDLTGVRFVLTDKQNDLWADNVYYDLEQAAILKPGEAIELDLQSYPRFPATALGIVSHLEESASDGTVAAEVVVRAEDGQTAVFPILAGRETASGREIAGDVRVARPWPSWVGSEGHDYLARLEFNQALIPTSVTVRVPEEAPTTFVLQGLSLIDQRTGAHASVTVSPLGDFRRIHSGDVKIYERTLASGRAWLVHGVQPSADDVETLRLLADPSFDPKRTVVLEGDFRSQPPQAAQVTEKVRIVEFGPENVHLEAEVTQPALLVLADAFYPGWSASVDGTPVPILRANLMFRAVALAPGRHNVSFTYKPSTWRWGVAISSAMLALLVLGVLAAGVPVRRFGTPRV